MLTITAQQMQAFAPQMRRYLEEHCVMMLRESYPKLTAQHSDEKLLEVVRFGCARAEKLGIASDDGIERFLHLMMRLGLRFDEEPRHAGLKQALTTTTRDELARLDEAERLAIELGAP